MRPIDADAYADHLEAALKKSVLEVDTDSVKDFLIAATLTAAVVSDLRDETVTPTIDAEPVRHGRWILGGEEGWPKWTCSVCDGDGRGDYKLCPWCGAKMDGGKDDGR